ncbi:hypothetical protein BG011_000919 [Mortierella polycephala]|uniref:F-box domain-containing protein n=1 Tax=Mortierella polycephala TaxID=41804 RepID=A0A9P6PLV5_9FUNG|nr:hypothetical protein BG011_000919 [Mortierella polycephala]
MPPRRSSRRLADKAEKDALKESDSESVPVKIATIPKTKSTSKSKSMSKSSASTSVSKRLTTTVSSIKGKQKAGHVANTKTQLKSTSKQRTTTTTTSESVEESAEDENVEQLSSVVINNSITSTTARRTRMSKNKDDGTSATTVSSGKKRRLKEEELHLHETTASSDAMEDSSSQGINADGRPKRQRRQTMKQLTSGDDVDMETDSSLEPLTVAPVPLPLNRTDPCAVLPIEIWYQILSLLRLSQVATISNVSKIWLDGSRSYPVWKTICELNRLGVPKRKYQSYLALACSRSSFICEKCLSITMGSMTERQSNIPLPVMIIDDEEEDEKEEGKEGMGAEEERALPQLGLGPEEERALPQLELGPKEEKNKEQDAEMDKVKQEEDEQEEDEQKKKEEEQKRLVEEERKKKKEQENTWMLCVKCRREYYKEHPEPMRTFEMEARTVWEADQITKTLACKIYHLDAEIDLGGIRYRERRNPHYRLAPNMRLYELEGIQRRALDIHGGWVGVDAISEGIVKKRRLAYNDRKKASQMTQLRLEKSKSREGSSEIGLTQESNDSAGDTQQPASQGSSSETGATQVGMEISQ